MLVRSFYFIFFCKVGFSFLPFKKRGFNAMKQNFTRMLLFIQQIFTEPCFVSGIVIGPTMVKHTRSLS